MEPSNDPAARMEEAAASAATAPTTTDTNMMYESLEPQPANLLQDGLQFMLGQLSVGADETLDVDLVEALLLEVGEYERAQNRPLLEQMVQAATIPNSNGRFDVRALAQALTSDVREHWEVGCEDGVSTYAEDVFGKNPMKTYREEQNGGGGGSGGTTKCVVQAEAMLEPFEMFGIDYVVDTHNSVLIVGVTWTFFFMVRHSVVGAFWCCCCSL